jgi:CheY-like chemotaxis protein
MTLILLVDDDLDSRENLAAVLRSHGDEVVMAANGREAHDWLLHAPALPSMILLDLVMPVMNGWDFRRQQLQRRDLAAIPVVILSGEKDGCKIATSLGAAAYLPKPVNPVSLLVTLQRACPRPS